MARLLSTRIISYVLNGVRAQVVSSNVAVRAPVVQKREVIGAWVELKRDTAEYPLWEWREKGQFTA